jgi:hypothetical protein
MGEMRPDQGMRSSYTRKGRLLVAAALMSTMLAACGGGDDSPSAAAPAPAAAPASTGSTGGSGLAATASAKGATTLSWQPPTTNDDGSPAKLTGYKIYWGLTEGHYTSSVTLDNPGLTRHVVEQLPPNTYYFVATALSAEGESEPSNVVKMKVL